MKKNYFIISLLFLFTCGISAQVPESIEADIAMSFRLSKKLFYSNDEISLAIADSALLVTSENKPQRFYGCAIKAVEELLYSSVLLNIDSEFPVCVGFMPGSKNKLDEAKIIYAEKVNGKVEFVINDVVRANPVIDKNNKRRTFEKDGLSITIESDGKIILFSIPKFGNNYFILPEYEFRTFKE